MAVLNIAELDSYSIPDTACGKSIFNILAKGKRLKDCPSSTAYIMACAEPTHRHLTERTALPGKPEYHQTKIMLLYPGKALRHYIPR
ncbi:hypothetical protein KCP70_14825 [Salmonella enterica subsp. enterica]|nr:hypothetical protein KCP70_14825 [Salmonella enterica subsp. enterica]